MNNVERVICGSSRLDNHSTAYLLERSGLPSVNRLAIRSIAVEAWKSLGPWANVNDNPLASIFIPLLHLARIRLVCLANSKVCHISPHARPKKETVHFSTKTSLWDVILVEYSVPRSWHNKNVLHPYPVVLADIFMILFLPFGLSPRRSPLFWDVLQMASMSVLVRPSFQGMVICSIEMI